MQSLHNTSDEYIANSLLLTRMLQLKYLFLSVVKNVLLKQKCFYFYSGKYLTDCIDNRFCNLISVGTFLYFTCWM